MNRPLLSVSGLCAGYGPYETLHGVSFDLRAGEIFCIAGESGCGKSTLLKALLAPRLFGVRIASGRVEPEGAAAMMALIPQDPGASFNPIRSFAAQFRETLESHGKAYDENEILAAFHSLDLKRGSEILRLCPYEMSGGMNQRVAIALALLLHPKILLCDEVTSALDVSSQAAVLDELMKLRDESGAALIMVTHNLAVAAKCADTVAIMHGGCLIEYGSASEVLYRPAHAYTRGLIAAIPSSNGGLPQPYDAEAMVFPDGSANRPYEMEILSANHRVCMGGRT